MNVRCEFGQEGLDSGSAVPRLAVPCGTRCWLPLWHLFFPALTPCVRMLFHPAVRTRRTAMPRSVQAHGSSVDWQVFFTGERGAAGALDGRADGATLALHRYGERAPRTRRGETREAVRSVCFCLGGGHVFFSTIGGEMGIPQTRRSFVRRSHFWSFNLVNWPPRQTDRPPPHHHHSTPPTAPPCCSGTLSAITASLRTPV